MKDQATIHRDDARRLLCLEFVARKENDIEVPDSIHVHRILGAPVFAPNPSEFPTCSRIGMSKARRSANSWGEKTRDRRPVRNPGQSPQFPFSSRGFAPEIGKSGDCPGFPSRVSGFLMSRVSQKQALCRVSPGVSNLVRRDQLATMRIL